MGLVVKGLKAGSLEMVVVGWGLEVVEMASLVDSGLVGLGCWVCSYRNKNQDTCRYLDSCMTYNNIAAALDQGDSSLMY